MRLIILKGNSKKFLLVHVSLETVLQDTLEKLIDIGRRYGLEMSVEKENRINENFKTTIPSMNYN